MAGMSESFRARGEQFRRLAEYQEALRLAELTGHVDAIRLSMVLCLMMLFMAFVGLFTLDGPA